jgi:hypothetical protein
LVITVAFGASLVFIMMMGVYSLRSGWAGMGKVLLAFGGLNWLSSLWPHGWNPPTAGVWIKMRPVWIAFALVGAAMLAADFLFGL